MADPITADLARIQQVVDMRAANAYHLDRLAAAGLPSTVPTLDTIYDASLLEPTGYWVHSEPGRWVAEDAVRGVRVDAALLSPAMPSLQARVADLDPGWHHLTIPTVMDALRAQARAQERRERNTAMLLWGVHL